MSFLTKLFIKKGQNPNDESVRESCGKKAGITCIILNTLLAGGKIALGIISGAVSVLADGFNNLTDCGSNVVSVIGFKISGKPADKEHPFGHQRAESLSALLISMIILFVALELAISSIEKILSPQKNVFSIYLLGILIISVIVKLFMFLLNNRLGKATSSDALMATAKDSLTDMIATFVVTVTLVISHYADVQLDGYAGVGVSLFIGFTGISLLLQTMSHLIGKAPDVNIVKDIEKRVMEFDGVHGIHDLVVHSYGQNKLFATVHVEVASSMPIMTAHELADNIEKDFTENANIELTVHIDPLVLDDPIINELKDYAEKVVKDIDENFKIHDFRVVGGDTHTNIVFDIVVPFESKMSLTDVENTVKEVITKQRASIGVVVTAERQYVEQTNE